MTSDSPSSSSKVSLPRDLWFKLSEEDRKLIIGYNKMIHAPSSTTPKKVQTHALDIDPEPDPDPSQEAVSKNASLGATSKHQDESDPVTQFINQAMTTDINHPASDLTSVLSNAKSKTSKKVSLKANMHKQEGHILHYLSSRKSTLPGNQLVERGANGGLAGSDMRILSKTGRHISIMGTSKEGNGPWRLISTPKGEFLEKIRRIKIFYAQFIFICAVFNYNPAFPTKSANLGLTMHISLASSRDQANYHAHATILMRTSPRSNHE